MNKKLLFGACAASFLTFAASCSSDDLAAPSQAGNEVTVQFSPTIGGAMSRAIADGSTATTLKYAVYSNGVALKLDGFNDDGYGTATASNGSFSDVSLTLVSGNTYDIVFWADAGENSPYTFNVSKGTISYKEDATLNCNSENLDAFYYAKTGYEAKGGSEKITLTRPFAQINLGTNDITAATTAGFTPISSSITVSDAYTSFNLLNGSASGNTSKVTFNTATIPTGDDVAFPKTDYSYLATTYVLAGATHDVTLNVTGKGSKSITRSYSAVPAKANYRTNIYGALLTGTDKFQIEIDKNFTDDDYDVEVGTRVSNEDEFNKALENPDENGKVVITLNNDITLTDGLTFGASTATRSTEATATTLKIGLNGKKITVPYFKVQNGATLSISYGTIETTAENNIINGSSALILDNITLNDVREKLVDASAAIGLGGNCNVTLKNSIINAPNSFFGISSNASNNDSYSLTLNKVTVNALSTALGVNTASTYYISDCTFQSALQAGMLRGGSYYFYGENKFILDPQKFNDRFSSTDWLSFLRKADWSQGNNVPSSPLTVGNKQDSNKTYYYPTNITIAEDAHVYVSVISSTGNNDGAKYPNAYFCANPEEGNGVYMNKLPEVLNSVSELNFVFGSKNIFVDGKEHDIYDPARTEDWTPTDKNDITLISSREQLAALATAVNNGTSYSNQTVQLGVDIDLNNIEWTPIGTSSNPFKGNFDGGNHTISNLYVNRPNTSYVGFFGNTNSGSVSNLKINNANVTGYLNVGAVSGQPYTSKYNNIELTGNVYVNGFSYVGGMFGKHLYASASNLTINANKGSYVSANSIEGDIAYRTYVGGLVGFMGEGSHTVSNVTTNINVIGTTCDAGGVTGIAHYGNTFENCKANCNVTLTDAAPSLYSEIGGIAGVWHNETGKKVTFKDCEFTGSLSSYNSENNYNEEIKGNTITGSKYSETGTGELYIDNVKIYPEETQE